VQRLDLGVVLPYPDALGIGEGLLEFGRQFIQAHGSAFLPCLGNTNVAAFAGGDLDHGHAARNFPWPGRDMRPAAGFSTTLERHRPAINIRRQPVQIVHPVGRSSCVPWTEKF